MKRLIAILGLTLIASTAWAFAILKASASTSVSVGVATGSAPTAASFTVASGTTAGTCLPLLKVQGIRAEICAASGQTLSGAGSLNAYLLNANGEVLRNPGIDNAISVTSTSCAGAACRCQAFPDQRVSGGAGGGCLMFVPNGVTVSGGSTVVVRIFGAQVAL